MEGLGVHSFGEPKDFEGLKFNTLGYDNMPLFNLDNEKDLIVLSNIDCQWSHGKKTKCRIHFYYCC